MQTEAFFYIVIVSFNAGDKLSATLRSVLEQSYENWKVIVQDGCSTDGSVGDASALAAGSGGRVILRVETDDGIYDAMNRALCAAADMEARREKKEGERAYIQFLNCGDLLAGADVLQTAAQRIAKINRRHAMRAQALAEQTHGTICYGDTYERTTGQVVCASPRMDDFACYRHLPCHQSVFYDLSLLSTEPFDLRFQVRADYEQFLRLRYKRHASCAYLRMTIADYEGKGFSETAENKKRSEQERKEIVAMYLPKKKILQYDAYRTVTLASLRGKLASSPKTAPLYQKIKTRLYRGKDASSAKRKDETS